MFCPKELSQQRKENPPTGSTLSSDANSIPHAPPSKKHRLDNFTPHDYNQTRFADVTRSHDPPAVPYTPYSTTTQANKKQHKVNGCFLYTVCAVGLLVSCCKGTTEFLWSEIFMIHAVLP